DAFIGVAGDDVAGPGSRPAHDVVAGPALDHHAVSVGQGGGAGGVGADAVALHHVAGRTLAGDPDAAVGVAGDDVAGAGGRPAHGVAASPDIDHHAILVGQGVGAGGLGADAVALHHVAGRAAVGDPDAAVGVAGDDVAGAGGRPAHDVVAGPGIDHHAKLVGQGVGAVGGGADAVALHHVAGRLLPRDVYAAPAEAADRQPLDE